MVPEPPLSPQLSGSTVVVMSRIRRSSCVADFRPLRGATDWLTSDGIGMTRSATG